MPTTPLLVMVLPLMVTLLTDAELAAAVSVLRKRGEVVIVNLPGHAAAVSELNCDRALAKVDGQWGVLPLQ